MNGADADRLAIEVKGLGKSFGRVHALRGLDLDVRWGETLTVLGPNGSGKTTLIKVLATLARPDRGTVRVAGMDVSASGRSVRRNVGVVTHQPLLYDELTGRENLTLFARLFGLDEAGERAEAAARRVGMSRRLDRRAGALSHGMRKRLGIARALLHEPLVLLMDEPESGLDQEAQSLLQQIVADGSTPSRAVLMTTHSLETGIALGDRLAVLAGGRVAYSAPAESVSASDLRRAWSSHAETAP